MAASPGQERADVAPNQRDAGAMEISGFTFSAATLVSLNKYGSWGALESIVQTITPLGSPPPKWRAIQNFISGTPRWWPNCSGTLGVAGKDPVPEAPVSNDRSLSYSPCPSLATSRSFATGAAFADFPWCGRRKDLILQG
jgi:hypothetical protein